jgi:hypothetical protein
MVDGAGEGGIMVLVGGEDRALLRSNPSAHVNLGTWWGASPCGRLPPSNHVPRKKAINLGVWGKAPTPQMSTGVPFVKIFRAN